MQLIRLLLTTFALGMSSILLLIFVPEDNGNCGVVRIFPDGDGDGYGTADGRKRHNTCETPELPAGFTLSSGDCDDSRADVNPGRSEICADGIDNNCNGLIDEDVCTEDQSNHK